MLRELGENVRLVHIATDTVSDGSLPAALEKITVVEVVEAIDRLSLKFASDAIHPKLGQLGVPLADAMNHHQRSLAVGEVHANPVVADLLVDASDEIRQRHILLQLLNDLVFVHRGNTLS